MIYVQRIYPRPDPYKAPIQCCQVMDLTPYTVEYNQRRKARASKFGFDPNKCMHHAQVTVNDKAYCRKHAGKIILEELESKT